MASRNLDVALVVKTHLEKAIQDLNRLEKKTRDAGRAADRSKVPRTGGSDWRTCQPVGSERRKAPRGRAGRGPSRPPDGNPDQRLCLARTNRRDPARRSRPRLAGPGRRRPGPPLRLRPAPLLRAPYFGLTLDSKNGAFTISLFSCFMSHPRHPAADVSEPKSDCLGGAAPARANRAGDRVGSPRCPHHRGQATER